jgi:hypothetical protein
VEHAAVEVVVFVAVCEMLEDAAGGDVGYDFIVSEVFLFPQALNQSKKASRCWILGVAVTAEACAAAAAAAEAE